MADFGRVAQGTESAAGAARGSTVRKVAEAVHCAHANGIVHRDLKPNNILLRPSQDEEGFGFEPVVTDFGSARGPRPPGASVLTATYAVLGTEQYMSPEQAAGMANHIGPASDIFLAGCNPL